MPKKSIVFIVASIKENVDSPKKLTFPLYKSDLRFQLKIDYNDNGTKHVTRQLFYLFIKD